MVFHRKTILKLAVGGTLLVIILYMGILFLSHASKNNPDQNINITGIQKGQVLTEKWTYAVQSPTGVKDEVDGISTDEDGNTFIGGLFSNTVDFGSVKRTAGKGSDIFVGKLDVNGKELWFKTFDSGADDFMWDLTADKNGDVILSGGYGGEFTVNGKTYQADKDGSAYYAKLDGKTGEMIWFQTAGVVGKTGVINAAKVAGGNEVTVDSKNNIIALLSAGGKEYQIGNQRFKRAGAMDSFIVKLSPAGNFLWAHQFAGDGRKQARAIGITGDDTIVFGHQLIGTIEDSGTIIDSGKGKKIAQGDFGMLSPDGKLMWMSSVFSEGFANVRGAGGDTNSGDAYFSGVITGDAKIAGTKVQGLDNGASFVAKFNDTGKLLWLRVLGNNQKDEGSELIASDKLVVISGGNKGENFNVYDENGNLLAENLFNLQSTGVRGTVTVFDEQGELISAYAPASTDSSIAGVLEFTSDQCIVSQYAFSGQIGFHNGDTYQTDSRDKDITVMKLCATDVGYDTSVDKVSLKEADTAVNKKPAETTGVSSPLGFQLSDIKPYGQVYLSLEGKKGVLVCFHGAGGSASGWSTAGTDKNGFVESLAKAGWSVVCPTSLNRETKQWDPNNTDNNKDVKNVDALLDNLGIAENTPVILAGHSNGGGFTSRYAVFSKRSKYIKAIQSSNASGLSQILKNDRYTFPTLFNYAECDPAIDATITKNNYQVLQSRSIPSILNQLDSIYEAGNYKNCHQFVDTGTKVLDLVK